MAPKKLPPWLSKTADKKSTAQDIADGMKPSGKKAPFVPFKKGKGGK